MKNVFSLSLVSARDYAAVAAVVCFLFNFLQKCLVYLKGRERESCLLLICFLDACASVIRAHITEQSPAAPQSTE